MSSRYKDRVSHQSIINRLERTLGVASGAHLLPSTPCGDLEARPLKFSSKSSGGGRRRRRCWQGTDRPLPLVAAAPVRRSSAGRGTGLPGRGGGRQPGRSGLRQVSPQLGWHLAAAAAAAARDRRGLAPGPAEPCAAGPALLRLGAKAAAESSLLEVAKLNPESFRGGAGTRTFSKLWWWTRNPGGGPRILPPGLERFVSRFWLGVVVWFC